MLWVIISSSLRVINWSFDIMIRSINIWMMCTHADRWPRLTIMAGPACMNQGGRFAAVFGPIWGGLSSPLSVICATLSCPPICHHFWLTVQIQPALVQAILIMSFKHLPQGTYGLHSDTKRKGWLWMIFQSHSPGRWDKAFVGRQKRHNAVQCHSLGDLTTTWVMIVS